MKLDWTRLFGRADRLVYPKPCRLYEEPLAELRDPFSNLSLRTIASMLSSYSGATKSQICDLT
jgi:hypothetical protein